MFIENKKSEINFEKGFYTLTRDVASAEGTITKGSIVYAWKNEDCPTKLWFEEKGGNNILVDFEEVKDALCKTDDIIKLEEKITIPKKIRELSAEKYRKKSFLWETKECSRRRDLERLIAENDDSNGTLKSLEKAYGMNDFLSKIGFIGTAGFLTSLIITYFLKQPNIGLLLLIIVFFAMSSLSSILGRGSKIDTLIETWEKDTEKQIYALEDSTPAVTDTVRPNTVRPNSDILIPKEAISFDTVEENYGGLVLNRTVK